MCCHGTELSSLSPIACENLTTEKQMSVPMLDGRLEQTYSTSGYVGDVDDFSGADAEETLLGVPLPYGFLQFETQRGEENLP